VTKIKTIVKKTFFTSVVALVLAFLAAAKTYSWYHWRNSGWHNNWKAV